MDSLKNYNIEFVKLKVGEHTFDYEIDDSFFGLKENSLITQGKVNVHLHIDRKERLMNFHFQCDGIIKTECDVCLDTFDLGISAADTVVVKIVESPKESSSELIYLGVNDIQINVYDIIYELICTQIPMRKNCEDNSTTLKSCNAEMLQILMAKEANEEEDLTQTDPRWDKLKNLKK